MNRRDRLRLEERRRESMASYQDHDRDQYNPKTLMDSFFQSQQIIQSLSSKPTSGENGGSKPAVISKSFRIPRKQNQPEKKDDQLDRSRSIYEPEEELLPNNINQNGRWSRVKPSARVKRIVPPSRSGLPPQEESSARNEPFPRRKPPGHRDFSVLKGNTPQEESFPPKEESFPPKEESFPPKEESFPPKEESFPPKEESFPPKEESFPPKEEPFPPKEPFPQRGPPIRRDFSPSKQRTASPQRKTPSRSWPSPRGERSHQIEPYPGKDYVQHITEEPLPKENLTRRQCRSRERFRNHLAKKMQARKDRLSIEGPSTVKESNQVKNYAGEDGSKTKKIKLDEDDDVEDEEGDFFERTQTSDAERAAAINNTPIQMVIYDRSHPDGKIDPKNVKTLHDWFNQIIKEELLSGTGIIPQYLSHSYKDGVFVIMSTNSPSADLLKGKMEHMSALWEGGKLECVYEPYEERIAVVTVPRSIIHPTCFFDMCKETNPELGTENWRLIAFEGNDIEGKTFTLAIDVNSFKSILATKGFVRCGNRNVEFILERN